MKKIWFAFIALLVSIFSIGGISLATYVFGNGSISEDATLQGDARIDDIYENYHFSDAEISNDEDYYDVYFFSQPRYARSISSNQDPTTFSYNSNENANGTEQNSSGAWRVGTGGKYDGYFPEPVGTSGPNKEFGYQLIRAYKGITYDQYQEIVKPTCDSKDGNDSSGGWPLRFSGFTYSYKIAADYGYAWQGDFKIMNLQDTLSYYDSLDVNGNVGAVGQPGIDGSLIGDHKVYFYPIFSSGKNYAGSSYYQTSVNVVTYDGSSTSLVDFWANENYVTVNNRQITYFSAYNLVLNDNKGNSNQCGLGGEDNGDGLYIFVAPAYSGHGWGSNWYSCNGSVSNTTSLENLGFQPDVYLRGHYNAYIYVYIQGYDSYISPSSIKEAIVGDKEIVKENSVTFSSDNNLTCTLYYWIERVYQYKILGQPTLNYDYNDTSAPYLYLSTETSSSTTWSPDYESQAIYIPFTEGTYSTEYGALSGLITSPDQPFPDPVLHYSTWNRNVMTIAAAADRIAYSITIDDTDEFTKANLAYAIPGTDFHIYELTESGDPGAEISEEKYANYTKHFVKILNPGLYLFEIQVKYAEDEDQNQQLSELVLRLRSVPYQATIRIVESNPSTNSSDHLIRNEDINDLLYTYEREENAVGTDYLTWDTTFSDATSGATLTFQQVYEQIRAKYGQSAILRDHVTGNEIPYMTEDSQQSFPILKYYIFYVDQAS